MGEKKLEAPEVKLEEKLSGAEKSNENEELDNSDDEEEDVDDDAEAENLLSEGDDSESEDELIMKKSDFPSPFAFSMYGYYPQGYGHPVQGNGQPVDGPWAAEPVYPTQESSTAEERPAGQPISPPQHPFYPQYPGFPQQPLHQQPFFQPRPVSRHNQQPGYYQPPQASYYQHPMMPVYRPPIEQLMQPSSPVQS